MSQENVIDWQQVEAVFHAALRLPEDQRAAWVRMQCADKPQLADEVLALIDSHDDLDCRLGRAVAATARQVDAAGSSRIQDQRLGVYRILKQIGQGGMGTVYLAERSDQSFKQLVAVKVIRGFAGQAELDRMRRERQILAELEHPNIARLIDGGNTDDGQPYLVMEYIDGVPLLAWCRAHGLKEHARLELILSLCDAMHFAHQHLVIHRDIKPSNVLVTAEGRPVLLDFGVAKFVSEPGSETVQTLCYYTPGFASPEQLAGKPISTASDIFALGKLLLSVLETETGGNVKPADGLFRRAQWRRGLNPELAAIVEQATRDEPDLRYSSVAALRADLVRYLNGRPVDAVPNRFGYRMRKFVVRNRPVVLVSLLAVVISLGLVWRLVAEYDRARLAEAAAVVEAEHARGVLDFLLDTIGAAAPGQAMGREVSVREVVDRGHQAILTRSDLEPALESRLLLALSEVYQQLELFADADALLQRAADSNEPATQVRALSLLGFGLVRRQHHDEAYAALQAARNLAASDGHIPDDLRLQLDNHWALWLLESGDAAAARAQFGRIADAHKQAGELELAAGLLHNQALAEMALGNLEQAVGLAQESLTIKADTIGRQHPQFANTLHILSVLQRQMGDFSGARSSLDEALQIRMALFGPDHPGLGPGFNELANVHHDLGDFDQAIEWYEKALEFIQRTDGQELARASYLNNLAMALEDQGAWDQATAPLRASLELRREVAGPSHPTVALALHNLARNQIRLGNIDEGGRLAEQALSLRLELLGEEHHQTLQTRALLGFMAYRQGQWDQAEQIQRRTVESLAVRLPATSLTVMSVRADWARSLIELGALNQASELLHELIDNYQRALGPDHPHAALLVLELARIDLLQTRREQARLRVQSVARLVTSRMAAASVHQRQLACLEAEDPRLQCWMPAINNGP